MKYIFHGINAEVNYAEIPSGVEKVCIEVALRVFAMETYEAAGGIGQEISPEIKTEAFIGEHEGKPVLKGIINGEEWASFLIPEKLQDRYNLAYGR